MATFTLGYVTNLQSKVWLVLGSSSKIWDFKPATCGFVVDFYTRPLLPLVWVRWRTSACILESSNMVIVNFPLISICTWLHNSQLMQKVHAMFFWHHGKSRGRYIYIYIHMYIYIHIFFSTSKQWWWLSLSISFDLWQMYLISVAFWVSAACHLGVSLDNSTDVGYFGCIRIVYRVCCQHVCCWHNIEKQHVGFYLQLHPVRLTIGLSIGSPNPCFLNLLIEPFRWISYFSQVDLLNFHLNLWKEKTNTKVLPGSFPFCFFRVFQVSSSSRGWDGEGERAGYKTVM